MIRWRMARLFRSMADTLDPPGFEYRVWSQPGEVLDWSKVSDEMRFAVKRWC